MSAAVADRPTSPKQLSERLFATRRRFQTSLSAAAPNGRHQGWTQGLMCGASRPEQRLWLGPAFCHNRRSEAQRSRSHTGRSGARHAHGITVVCTASGTTEPIQIETGVQQGCPLSGLLFNLAVNSIIRKIQGGATNHQCLAYADDMTPLADDPGVLQQCIDTAVQMCEKLGLKINPAKCVALHLLGRRPVGLRDTEFSVNRQRIPSLGKFESILFLGRPIGFSLLRDDTEIDRMVELGHKILNKDVSVPSPKLWYAAWSQSQVPMAGAQQEDEIVA